MGRFSSWPQQIIIVCLTMASLGAEVSRADSGHVSGTRDERHCLALALYWEARAEGRPGMVAVAAVVLNRTRHPDFPATICSVVTQGGQTPPCQFSWWCDGKPDEPGEARAWREAWTVAGHVLEQRIPDPTEGALFFHAAGLETPWRRSRTQTVTIGNHVFYR